MREYVDIPEPGIDLQIAQDMKDLMVREHGRPDNEQTLGLAILQLAMVRLRVRTRSELRAPGNSEQDELYARYGMVPKALAFWIHTLVGAVGRERGLANQKTLYERRVLDPDGFRMTVLDQ